MGLSLGKIEKEAPELLSLAKTAQDVVGKSKLNGRVSRVALALDYSGSMHSEYASGAMQRLAEKVLALGTQLDDDGEIDLFFFATNAWYAGTVNISNFRDVIAKETRGLRMGTTNYEALFAAVLGQYGLSPFVDEVVSTDTVKGGWFRKDRTVDVTQSVLKPVQTTDPVLVVFLTDGSPDSQSDAKRALTEASYAPVFWQFLSIGRDKIPFLQKLDDLPGRYIDNADYKPVRDVDRIGEAELFELLLDEYPGWIAEQTSRGNIR